jgi:hypothetical protein
MISPAENSNSQLRNSNAQLPTPTPKEGDQRAQRQKVMPPLIPKVLGRPSSPMKPEGARLP